MDKTKQCSPRNFVIYSNIIQYETKQHFIDFVWEGIRSLAACDIQYRIGLLRQAKGSA